MFSEKESWQHTNSTPLFCHGKSKKIMKENDWHKKFLHWLPKYYKFGLVLILIYCLTLISKFYLRVCIKYQFYFNFIYNNVSQTI